MGSENLGGKLYPHNEWMVSGADKESSYDEAIIQNLMDAGCDKAVITAFVEDIHAEKIAEGLKLLAVHRSSLLDELHKEQKRIDCLDYLVYKMEKLQKN